MPRQHANSEDLFTVTVTKSELIVGCFTKKTKAVSIDSVAIRDTKQLLTLTTVAGFPAHCSPPGYGPVTYKPESGCYQWLGRHPLWYLLQKLTASLMQ